MTKNYISELLQEDWCYQVPDVYYDNTYGHKFMCDNCGKYVYILVKKGIRIPKNVKCEECGCLSKT